MMKFFRKHNKKLLAIFMVLLMIVFLGGSALDSLLRPDVNRIVATSRWGDIGYFDHREGERTTGILSTFGIDWQRPVGPGFEPLDTIDWILLVREAKHLGTQNDIARVRSSLTDPYGIQETARRLREKPERIMQAIAEYASIQETAFVVAGATHPSAAVILTAARESLDKVKFNAIMLPAQVFVDETFEPSETQIQAQFEAYREQERGPGLAFGYYVPTALKVQYIKIDRDALAEKVRVADLKRKAKAYYEERRERDPAFARPKDDAEVNSETGEGPQRPKPEYLDWEQARPIAEAAVRKQEADEAASRMADWLAYETAVPWSFVDREENGYSTAPPKVAEPAYYNKVLDHMPREIAYPDAVTVSTTGFFAQEEADKVPGIGEAYFVSSRVGQWEKLSTIAFRTSAVVPKIPNQKGINRSDYLSRFQTSRYPLRDNLGNVYVFRIVDAREAHIPASPDEVHDRIVEDLRLLNGYETAVARAESLRSCGADGGLEAAFESDDELIALRDAGYEQRTGFYEVPPVARESQYQAMSGMRVTNTPIAVPDIRTLPTNVIDEIFSLEHAATKTEVFELKDRATVMVAEWVETQRGQAHEFAEQRERFTKTLITQREQAVMRDWLKPETIRARNQFALVTN